jgi:hypothetical protein
LFWPIIARFFVGVSFSILPPYASYCQSNQANDYYCAAYSVAMTLGNFLDTHGVAVTALALIEPSGATTTKRSTALVPGLPLNR